jgi:hypothetical protein
MRTSETRFDSPLKGSAVLTQSGRDDTEDTRKPKIQVRNLNFLLWKFPCAERY